MSDSIPLSPLPRISPDAYAFSDTDHDRPPSLLESDAPPDYHPPKDPTSLELHPRSRHALLLALFYAAITLAPWVIICLLNNNPIGGDRYGARTGDNTNYHWRYAEETQAPFEKSERWYYAARVIQAIASVVTLPLSSAICASAAVVFMQRQERLTIPQLMTLADRGWLDWATYGRIVTFQWSRYGSSFLLFAVVANLLGLLISPLQSIFLSSEVVKTPTAIQGAGYLIDLPSQFAEPDPSRDDNNIITIKTRVALETAGSGDRDSHLWTTDGNASACAPYICTGQGTTSGDVSDTFMAELPSGFHTGLLRQFLPRVNSTARYEVIEEADFPDDCDQIPNAFFVEYANTTRYYNTDTLQTWGLRACMPADVTQSPWAPTRDRHSFSEELYLDVRLENYGQELGSPPRRDYFRVTLDTTSGYFELPNYMNNGIPGPLLDKDPTELCDDQCESQGSIRHPNDNYKARRDVDITSAADRLQEVYNKGPLLVIAMALFGDGSFIDTRARHPEAYAGTILPDYSSDDWPYPDGMSACRYLAPLSNLLPDITRVGCISNSRGGENGWNIRHLIAEWLLYFQADPPTLASMFTTAAYLSHKAWMGQGAVEPSSYRDRFTVSFDMGVDREKPVISQTGMIVVSTLLGVHVLSLFALGVYAAWTPRWTKRLDSFAIMRIGASIAKHVPLWMVYKTRMVKELDEVPGWIGDQMPESEDVGVLGLGGPSRLRKGRKYLSYHNKPQVPNLTTGR
ncbi:hypothetical protein BJX62DRAFT_246176 [Aspergillus germanicus]